VPSASRLLDLPPLEWLASGLTDQRVAEASALPGWSRGHVLAHLADTARMFTRLAEYALRGELVAPYDGGMDERDAIIDAAAARSAAEHRAELARHTARLHTVWERARHRLPSQPPGWPDARPRFHRWRRGLPALGPWPPHPPQRARPGPANAPGSVPTSTGGICPPPARPSSPCVRKP
jgi:uncharacterized protein (TIGR03083 family)